MSVLVCEPGFVAGWGEVRGIRRVLEKELEAKDVRSVEEKAASEKWGHAMWKKLLT